MSASEFLKIGSAAQDADAIDPDGTIVFDAEAPAGESSAETALQPGNYVFRGASTLHHGELVRFENDGYLIHMIGWARVKTIADAHRAEALLLAGKAKQAAHTYAIGQGMFDAGRRAGSRCDRTVGQHGSFAGSADAWAGAATWPLEPACETARAIHGPWLKAKRPTEGSDDADVGRGVGCVEQVLNVFGIDGQDNVAVLCEERYRSIGDLAGP